MRRQLRPKCRAAVVLRFDHELSYRSFPIPETEMRVSGKPDLGRRDLLKVAGVAAALGLVPLTAGVAMAADSQKLKIGVIGSGRVGSALGGVWARVGHEVMFSSRH